VNRGARDRSGATLPADSTVGIVRGVAAMPSWSEIRSDRTAMMVSSSANVVDARFAPMPGSGETGYRSFPLTPAAGHPEARHRIRQVAAETVDAD